MANPPRGGRPVPADAGDPGQRSESKPQAKPEELDNTPVDAEALIQETKDAAELKEFSAEPRSEADSGGSGVKKSLRTKGPYMILDPTTGVEVTEEAREVEVSAFLQGKIADGLIEEA